MKEILKEFIVESWVKSGLDESQIKTFTKQSMDASLLGVLFGNIPALAFMLPATAGGLAYFASHPDFAIEDAMKKRRESFQIASENQGADEMEEELKRKNKLPEVKPFNFMG